MLGSGTQANPYIIQTPQDLHDVRNNLTANYELGNDIDMSAWGLWNPISYYDNVTWVNGFSGNFDGKGYKIKNLTISKNEGGIYLGLFGQFINGTLQNVALENVQINTGGSGNNRLVGALIGYAYNATIINCYATEGSVKAQEESGGLIGKVWQCNISDCYTNNNVTLATSYYGGGFVGSVDSNTTITNCYSSGKVTYSQTSLWNGVSGFAGFVRNKTDIIFSNCIWDKDSSGQVNPPKIGSPPSTVVSGVIGKTTSEMKQQSTYLNWDFVTVWNILPNEYPKLKSFLSAIDKKVIITLTSKVANLTDLSVKGSKKHVKSTASMDDITSNIMPARKKSVQPHSYVGAIASTATRFARIVRAVTNVVTSHLKPISSATTTTGKVMRKPLSRLKRIITVAQGLINPSLLQVDAYAYHIENPSNHSHVESMTSSSVMENPSFVEVIE
ncbi:GLUG motif-containing protein [Brevibacillus fortis]|uniref:GLUG motif-containing protein n=1 Tax=Brevibacillus fortis TaxID=2126352 RepID=UPI0038FCFE42